jgi:protein involved in polysaccharide export with SLBB domain
MFNPPHAGLRRCLAGVLLVLLAAAAPAPRAQSPGLGGGTVDLLQAGRRPDPTTLGLSTPPLEGALDPARYPVGPGDVFAVSIGGQLPVQYRTAVSAEGLLLLPDVGSFRVADRSLADVKADLEAALRRTYRSVETSVALAEPRRFYVHVSGAVLDPGRHLVPPVSRVEDALAQATGGLAPRRLLESGPARQALAARAQQATSGEAVEAAALQAPEALLGTDYRPAYRNVRVVHRDGSVALVDLLRYYATGDAASNPYLRDGDAVHVPFYDPDAAGVGVAGAVAEPGVYDVRPDDTVRDLLVVALGPTADVEAVRLVRAATGEAFVLDPADLATTPVEAGDRLFVLDEAAERGTAEAVGAVRFPAAYPIVEGRTTLGDLLAAAGGLLPDALVRGAYLERRPPQAEPGSVADPAVAAADPTLDPALREAALADLAFERARLSSLDFAGRQYLAREVSGFQRVSVDVPAVLRGEGGAAGSPVLLRDGDRLVVPFDLDAVAVLGQVLQPGYVPFAAGRRAEDYVAAAGGRAAAAAETYVMDAATGALTLAEEAGPLRSGDAVFVNRLATADDRLSQQLLVQERQIEIQERREATERQFRTLTTALQAVATAVSVTALIISISR